MSDTRPIGVFDSGIGGLTVVKALRDLLPNENIFYLGDTARVPYGPKSPETVQRYALELAGMLMQKNAKTLVVACNTVSSVALPLLTEKFSVPVIGVIEPGARAALQATRNRHIGVIGTHATIRSGAYEKALRVADNNVRVSSRACPLLVPLIEEGLLDDDVTDRMIMRYLEPMLADGIDTLVLGCTHYPLLTTRSRECSNARSYSSIPRKIVHARWKEYWIDIHFGRRRQIAVSYMSLSLTRPTISSTSPATRCS